MLDTVPGALQDFSHLITPIILGGGRYSCYPHFTDDKNETYVDVVSLVIAVV